MKNMLRLTIALLASMALQASAAELKVYGAAGPAPAYKAAAAAFEQSTGVKVTLVAGLLPAWIDRAKADADLVFSGSEHMMYDFAAAFGSELVIGNARALYARPLAIVVRDGNPKMITGIKDLIDKDLKIEVVNGSGLTGAWEDMFGRSADLRALRGLQKHIAVAAKNSAEAKQLWLERTDLDAWITWSVWPTAYKQLGQIVPIEGPYALYRPTAIAPTQRGLANPETQRFVDFLASPEGAKIFASLGWDEGVPAK